MFTLDHLRFVSHRPFARVAGAILLISACRSSEPACEGPRAARAVGSWRLAIRVPDSVQSGDPVLLALVLQNVGESALDPGFGGASDADFVVTRPSDTTEVWRKFHGFDIRMGAQLKRTFAPGDTFRIEERWDQHDNAGQLVRRGVYCVWGNLDTRGLDSLRTEVATLRIVQGQPK